MNDNSRVISARLSPQIDEERKALELFDQWVQEGYTPREIITDALNRAGNQAPSIYRERGTRVGVKPIGTMLENMSSSIDDLKRIIQELWRSNPEQLRQMVNNTPADGSEIELDDEFLANAAQILRPTYRKMRGEE